MRTARFDVEHIRVPAERSAFAALEATERSELDLWTPPDAKATRRELLTNALLLTETMAPHAYAAANEAMSALGVDDHIELFQARGDGYDNVRLVLTGDPIGIEFVGAYLDERDHGGLVAALGHEIGHCLAHGGRRLAGWDRPALGRATSPARRAYWMAAELTADRFGLLACRDLDAVLRLEMQTVAGRSARSVRLDTEAYLAQCRTIAEETSAAGGVARGYTHPEHYVRGYAEWLFSETDVYRSITGLGPGSRSIDEVDAILEKLIGPPSKGATADASAPRAARMDEVVAPVARSAVDDDGGWTRALRETLANVAGAAVPRIRRLTGAARDQTTASEADRSSEEDASDPLEDERRELIARFEELERRSKKP